MPHGDEFGQDPRQIGYNVPSNFLSFQECSPKHDLDPFNRVCTAKPRDRRTGIIDRNSPASNAASVFFEIHFDSNDRASERMNTAFSVGSPQDGPTENVGVEIVAPEYRGVKRERSEYGKPKLR